MRLKLLETLGHRGVWQISDIHLKLHRMVAGLGTDRREAMMQLYFSVRSSNLGAWTLHTSTLEYFVGVVLAKTWILNYSTNSLEHVFVFCCKIVHCAYFMFLEESPHMDCQFSRIFHIWAVQFILKRFWLSKTLGLRRFISCLGEQYLQFVGHDKACDFWCFEFCFLQAAQLQIGRPEGIEVRILILLVKNIDFRIFPAVWSSDYWKS